MQGEKETFCDFLRRTDTLALKLGLTLDELPDVMGISRASLFGYRAGKRPLTGKAWLKLEEAEKKAAAASEPPVVAASDPARRMDQMDERLTRIEGMLADIMKAMAGGDAETSSKGRGKKLA